MKSRMTYIYLSLFVYLSMVVLTGCGSSETTIELGQKSKHMVPQTKDPELLTVKVISRYLHKEIRIPGELAAFRDVPIYPKVPGFIKAMYVDRGSVVKYGQILMEIVAPELSAQYGEAAGKLEAARSTLLEAESKIESLLSQQKEFEAKLSSYEAVYKRIQRAAKTPGAIADTDLDEAQQKVEGAKAHVQSLVQNVQAARSQLESEKGKIKAAEQALSSVREMKAYLTIMAPFAGVITERNVHEGALVSSIATNKPMLRIQQTSVLRLLVPVSESAISGMHTGTIVKFTVPAFTGKIFTGTVKRVGHALETRTRSMPVEADVENRTGELEPGMYPEVVWDMERPYTTLFVPSSAVATTAESTFVIRIKNGITQYVEITRGQTMGDLVEVVGDVQEGDEIVLKATEELKPGTKVRTRLLSVNEQQKHFTMAEDKNE